jgi:hypothetical protein
LGGTADAAPDGLAFDGPGAGPGGGM